MLLGCKEKNDYWSEGPARVKWFHFNGSGVEPLMEHIYKTNGSGHMNAVFGEQTEHFVDDILQGLKSERYSEFQFSRDIYGLLCLLAEQSQSLKNETPAEETIRRAVAHIHRHYAEPLSVQALAAAVNLSPYYFTRLFKRVMMTSPHLFLLNCRLDAAKKRLIYTRDKIDTIARQTGFQSSSYFVRAFHREMKMTPNDFRQYFSVSDAQERDEFSPTKKGKH